MESNPEQRNNTRFKHEAPVKLENFEIGVFHRARMFNYSDGGLYFESDYLISPGTELYIGINNSPYAQEPYVYECYRAEIRWCRPLKRSSYYYGYGAKFIEGFRQNKNVEGGADLRKHPRKDCTVPAKYVAGDKIFQGEIKNISSGGIFLKTNHPVSIGQRLHLAIPVRKKGKILKCSGKIVWSDQRGVGVEFQRGQKK
jgi:Tfp pilus assembly protein PilZ